MRVVSLGLCFIPSWPPLMRNIDCQVAPSLSDRVGSTWWQCVQCSIQVGGWSNFDPYVFELGLKSSRARKTNQPLGRSCKFETSSCDVLCLSYVFFLPSWSNWKLTSPPPQLLYLRSSQVDHGALQPPHAQDAREGHQAARPQRPLAFCLPTPGGRGGGAAALRGAQLPGAGTATQGGGASAELRGDEALQQGHADAARLDIWEIWVVSSCISCLCIRYFRYFL